MMKNKSDVLDKIDVVYNEIVRATAIIEILNGSKDTFRKDVSKAVKCAADFVDVKCEEFLELVEQLGGD